MFSGYTATHPPGNSGLARWTRSPAAATTPSAQALAAGSSGGTVDATPRAGTGGTTMTPQPQTPAARAAGILQARTPPAAPPPADPYHPAGYTPGVAASPATPAPTPAASLARPPATTAPPPAATSLAAPSPAAPAPTSLAPYTPQASDYMPVPQGFVSNGAPVLRSPLNIDGTALSGAQLAALAGTGRPGDPFQGGFTPNGGWSADNGGRSPTDQAAQVAAYQAQYGNPSVTLQSVLSNTSTDVDAREAERRRQQEWMDSVGRFL